MRRTRELRSSIGVFALVAAAGWAGGSGESTSPLATSLPGPLGRYEPAITISTVRALGDTVKLPKGQSLADNVWSRLYRDALGIRIDYLWTAAVAGLYDERVNLTIASGRLPDVMAVNKNQLARLAKTNLIRKDLGTLLEGWASPLLRSVLGQEGSAPTEAATFDGVLCGLPSTGSTMDSAPVLWLRADWLRKLGLEAPTTYDELLHVMEAFVTRDPQGTGGANYIGLATNKELAGGFAGYEGFCNMFGAYPQSWVEKNGRLVYGSLQPEMRLALQELRELYAKGMLDKEFAVKDAGKISELCVSGRCGAELGQMWNALWPLQSCRDLHPEADWVAYPLPSATGKPAHAQTSLGTTAWYVVSSQARYPEAVVKMLSLWVEKAWGEGAEPETYLTGTIDGAFYEMFKLAELTAWPARKNLDAHRKVVGAARSGDTSGLNGEELQYYERDAAFRHGDDAEWGYARVFGEQGSLRVIDSYLEHGLLAANAFTGPDTPAMSSKGSRLYRQEIETFTRLILGAPIEEFDQFADSAMRLGGAEIEREVNEWYGAERLEARPSGVIRPFRPCRGPLPWPGTWPRPPA